TGARALASASTLQPPPPLALDCVTRESIKNNQVRESAPPPKPRHPDSTGASTEKTKINQARSLYPARPAHSPVLRPATCDLRLTTGDLRPARGPDLRPATRRGLLPSRDGADHVQHPGRRAFAREAQRVADRTG